MVEKIIKKYKEICTNLSQDTTLNSISYGNLIIISKNYSLDEIIEVFKKANESDFLTSNNKWQATFQWLVDPKNFAKVKNGNYDESFKSKPRKKRTIMSHEYDFKKLEKELLAKTERKMKRRPRENDTPRYCK